MLGLLTTITFIGDVMMIFKKTRIIGAIIALTGGISLQAYVLKDMNDFMKEEES